MYFRGGAVKHVGFIVNPIIGVGIVYICRECFIQVIPFKQHIYYTFL